MKKILKSILFSLAFFMICSAGVLADDTVQQPTAYINANGVPTQQQLTPLPTDSNTNTLTSNTYYWAGTTTDIPVSLSTPTTLKFPEAGGTFNIVVGPSSVAKTAAYTLSNLSIPTNVTLNIYQAANGLGTGGTTAPAANQCILQVGDKTTEASESASPGITFAEGTQNGVLNVYSGSVECYGTPTTPGEDPATPQPGIDVNGTVNVGLYGTLLAEASGTPSSTSVDIDITDGSLTTSGTLVANSGIVPSTTGGPIVGGNISGLSNLTVNNGLVIASNKFDQSALNQNSKGGIWSSTNTNGISTNIAFGTSTWVTTGITLQNSDANLTVQPGASLTLANSYQGDGIVTWNFVSTDGNDGNLTIRQGGTLNIGVPETAPADQQVNGYFTGASTGSPYAAPTVNFGTQGSSAPTTPSTSTVNTLTINSNGTLNIAANANVNMYANSTLANSGMINVATTSES